MKKKFIIILTAITAIFSMSFSLQAYAEDDILNDEEIIVEETSVSGISEEEFNAKSDELQEQIDEMFRLFAENGYSIEDINGDVDGINKKINSLQMSMEELYSMIESLKDSFSADRRTPEARVTTAAKEKEETTSTTSVHAEPDTEPNGYIVESVNKNPKERDFISVTTRDGHVFYVVIDYEDNNKKVYFLNTVDTADLEHLLAENGTVTTVSAKEDVKEISETVPTTAEKKEEKKPAVKKNSNLVLYIIGGAIILVFLIIAKKKVSGNKKKYDDEDNDVGADDFTNEEPEIYTNEDEE